MGILPTRCCYHHHFKTNLTAASATLLDDTMPTDYIFTFYLHQTRGWSCGLTKCQQGFRRYRCVSRNVSSERTVAFFFIYIYIERKQCSLKERVCSASFSPTPIAVCDYKMKKGRKKKKSAILPHRGLRFVVLGPRRSSCSVRGECR